MTHLSLAFALWSVLTVLSPAQSAALPRAETTFVFAADRAGFVTVYELDEAAVGLTRLCSVACEDPLEFLALARGGQRLYALGSTRIHTLEFTADTRQIFKRAETATPFRGTHLELDPSESCLYAVSYGEHAAAVFPLIDAIPRAPASPQSPWAGLRNLHQIRVHPATGDLFVPCLGTDAVAIFRRSGIESLELLGSIPFGTGSGPRHLDFHPTLDRAYVLTEKSSELTVLEPAAWKTSAPRTQSTVPVGASGSRSSDVRVTADGHTLYALHREPRDEVVAFALDEGGTPTFLSRHPTGGRHARTLAIDRAGRHIITANTATSNLTIFRRLPDGTLVPQSMTKTAAAVWSVATMTTEAQSRPRPEQKDARDLSVMTYNVRYGTAADGESRWELRREALIAQVTREAPSILGVQEALQFQLKTLQDALPQHQSLGTDRRGGRDDEHCSLLIDSRTLEVVEHGQFWFGPTPEVPGSVADDAALPRIAVWAALRPVGQTRSFLAINTHFDHRGQTAREASARQIVDFVDRLGLPTVLLGDLNAGEDDLPLWTLRGAEFRDTFRCVHPEATATGTFTDFIRILGKKKIDHILTRGPFAVVGARILDERTNGRYPSDHLPVTATLRF